VNGYSADSITSGSTCILRCSSWKTIGDSEGYLESTCSDDGEWSITMANDGNVALDFPPFPDESKYPQPDDEIQNLQCECRSLEVKWPLNAAEGVDTWWYDPNFEAGTVLVCDDPISIDGGEYTIKTGNACILFCDSHLVATVKCLNGEWTGNPERGFWCYKEPKQENKLKKYHRLN